MEGIYKPLHRSGSEVSSNSPSTSGTCNDQVYFHSFYQTSVVREIADHRSGKGMILLLGETASQMAQDFTTGEQKIRFFPVKDLEEAKEQFFKNKAVGLIISRDRRDINPENVLNLIQNTIKNQRTTPFLLLWPPDEMLNRFIRLVHASTETIADIDTCDPEKLKTRIATLEAKNATLEGSIRTLVAALSQCDPWPEAYAGEESAWELVMQGLPVADRDSEEYSGIEDDEGSDEEGEDEE